MRMTLAGVTVAAAAILTGIFVGGTARAEVVYPWCMTQADGRVSCSFTSFAQCQASAAGKSAFCSENPQYQRRSR
jgi:hypothetical protein